MRNALKREPSFRTQTSLSAQHTDMNRAGNTGSEWQFLTVATPAGDLRGEKSWFKREGSSEWERVDTFRWPQLGPLFDEQFSAANDDARVIIREGRGWGRTIAKLLGLLAVLGGLASAGIYRDAIAKYAHNLPSVYSGPQVSTEIEAGLAKAVLDMRPGLPKRIDQVTTLMWVSYSGTKMIYDNRIEVDGSKIDESTKAKLSQLVTVNACGTPQSRKLLDLGGAYRYVYSDRNAKILLTVDISKNQCP